MSINARRDPHFKRLCKLFGKEEWPADPRFATPRDRVVHQDVLLAEMRKIVATKTGDEWNRLISEIDVLNAKVQTHLDLFDDEQVQAVDAIRWVENDTLGWVPMASTPGLPIPETGDRLTHSPHVGEHNEDVLRELGYAQADIEALRAKGIIGVFEQTATG